jgi:S-adenosylmethionine synthetase
MRPYFIEQRLKLRNPILQRTASYGHMERIPETVINFMLQRINKKQLEAELFIWEKLDFVDGSERAFGLKA